MRLKMTSFVSNLNNCLDFYRMLASAHCQSYNAVAVGEPTCLKFTNSISLIRLSIIISFVSSLETFKIFFFFFSWWRSRYVPFIFCFPIYVFGEYFYSEESSSFVLGKLYSLISFSSRHQR